MLHATFLAAVTEFVWLPWRAAVEGSLSEGATQGGLQVGVQGVQGGVCLPCYLPACLVVGCCSCRAGWCRAGCGALLWLNQQERGSVSSMRLH